MTSAPTELDRCYEHIRGVEMVLLQGQLRGQDLRTSAEQSLAELYRKVMASTEVEAKKTMDALSEIVRVEREYGIPVAAALWEGMRTWLKSHWIEHPEFVQNSIWMIAHGQMRDLYFRIEDALHDEHPDTREDAREA